MKCRPCHIARALLVVCVVWGASPAWGKAKPGDPQRIVSLKPNITEILFALGAGKHVVGVTRWCDFPPAAARLPKVADYLQPNLEAVLALQPDLVIGSTENSLQAPVTRLQQQGIRVVLLTFDSLASTFDAIHTMGQIVGAPQKARALTQQLRRQIDRLHADPPPTRHAVLLVGTSPLVAAGPRSLLGELLVAAGGHNAITATHPHYPRISLEQLLAAQPEVILLADHTPTPTLPTDIATRTINLDTLRAGPRLGAGLHALQQAMRSVAP